MITQVSDLGFGCANLASMSAGAGGRASVRLVRHAFDRGVVKFDSADAYGDGMSERVLSRAFRGKSDEVQIATKAGYRFTERPLYERMARLALRPVIGRVRPTMSRIAETARGPDYVDQDFSVAHLTAALDGSLRRLDGIDIELYQLHEPPMTEPGEILDWAAGALKAGKFKKFGVSIDDPAEASFWLAHPVVTSVQLPFGLLDQRGGDDAMPGAVASGADIIVRGVLGSGLLDDRLTTDELKARTDRWQVIEALRAHAKELGVTTVQLAFWFVRARADVSTFLVGMSSANHVDSSVSACTTPLPSAEVLAAIAADAESGEGSRVAPHESGDS